jgi:hypothetical protein
MVSPRSGGDWALPDAELAFIVHLNIFACRGEDHSASRLQAAALIQLHLFKGGSTFIHALMTQTAQGSVFTDPPDLAVPDLARDQ